LNRVHGMHAFEYPRVDPRFNDVSNKVIVNSTTVYIWRWFLIATKVLRTWLSSSTLVVVLELTSNWSHSNISYVLK